MDGQQNIKKYYTILHDANSLHVCVCVYIYIYI
jgi:hypothetical protein